MVSRSILRSSEGYKDVEVVVRGVILGLLIQDPLAPPSWFALHWIVTDRVASSLVARMSIPRVFRMEIEAM